MDAVEALLQLLDWQQPGQMENDKNDKRGVIISMSGKYIDPGDGFESRPGYNDVAVPQRVKKQTRDRFYDIMITELLTDVQLRKSKFHKDRSAETTKSIYKSFEEYLNEAGLSRLRARDIGMHHVADYRVWLQTDPGRVSNRTVNNHINYLVDFFNYAKKNYKGAVAENPAAGIGKIPSRSESHEVYPDALFKEVVSCMRESDEYLAFFCRFVVYCFMRPKEIRLIQLKHINLDEGIIRMPVDPMKTEVRTKYIMANFIPELKFMRLQRFNPDHYLFSLGGRPGSKPVSKNFFTERFVKIREKLNLSDDYTIYGMRHTAVCQLLKSGTEWHEIMKRTGHQDMASFQKYARQIFAEPPIDLSNKYSVHL